MLVDIDKIRIEDRIRKDLGDISELAKDIEQNGLINPPSPSIWPPLGEEQGKKGAGGDPG